MSETGLEIRELTTVEQVHRAADVLDEVWPGEVRTMPANILRALSHSGNYVVGVFEGERLVGASAAFFGAPDARTMHSHITGVLPDVQGRGVGRLLKQHQREWALARGVGRVTWTFDPLIARNAHFNLRVLGARATEYLVDQYGSMDDDVNRGDASDRILVSWALAEPPAPTPAGADVVTTVSIPPDVEALRRTAPADAARWRTTVRTSILDALGDGLVIGGFDDTRGYLFVSP